MEKRFEHKKETILKFIEGNIVGLLKTHELLRIKHSNFYETPENTLDKYFDNYLDNFCREEKDRNYWKQRYFN